MAGEAVGGSEWGVRQKGRTARVLMIMGGTGEDPVGERCGENRWCSMSKEEGGAGVQNPGWSQSGGGQAMFQKEERWGMDDVAMWWELGITGLGLLLSL